MKKPILSLVCLLGVLIPHAAIAGGSSWEYQVVKFKKTSPTSAEFSLRPTFKSGMLAWGFNSSCCDRR
ncbi:MAG: hypothetical protein ACIWVG_07270, partial [Gloeotrichia echinulata HAB0833]